jgi:hypothetical protein
MSSVTSCVGGGLFICFTFLHVPYSTVTLIASDRTVRHACAAFGSVPRALQPVRCHWQPVSILRIAICLLCCLCTLGRLHARHIFCTKYDLTLTKCI